MQYREGYAKKEPSSFLKLLYRNKIGEGERTEVKKRIVRRVSKTKRMDKMGVGVWRRENMREGHEGENMCKLSVD